MQTKTQTYVWHNHRTMLPHLPEASGGFTFVELIDPFLDYATYELTLRKETVTKYNESLHWLLRDLPHLVYPSDLTLTDVTTLKKKMVGRGCKENRICSVIYALRSFLRYCRKVHSISTLEPSEAKPVRIPLKEVEYLPETECHQLMESINTKGRRGLKTRALMEFLFSTGLRVSEALSLNRDDLDWTAKEVVVVGKGNKQRTVFFQDRAAEWLQKYLATRKDDNPALFLSFRGTRLSRADLAEQFRRYAKKAGLKKRVTPHTLRRSMANLMLHNGASLHHIQHILGHSSPATTSKYYLGSDKESLKEAHNKYFKF